MRAAQRRPRHTRTGRIALPRVDGRTISAKRYRSLVESLEADIGPILTEPERALIAQAATLQLQCEQLQRAIVEGRDVDGDMLIRLASEHRRIMVNLRAKAAANARSTGPTLAEYVARRAAEKAASPSEGGAGA